MIPSVFNRDVADAVAAAVADQAKAQGTAEAPAARSATRAARPRSLEPSGPERRTPHMRITITGASGLIGTKLAAALEQRGDEVTKLSLRQRAAGPGRTLAGRDAIVHLAGENVAQRWNDDSRKAIRESRELGTRNLVAGDRAGRPEAEGADQLERRRLLRPARRRAPRRGHPARRRLPRRGLRRLGARGRRGRDGLRVVKVRTGVVLDKDGGALSKMLLPFKLGVGGPVAGGEQYMPWIHVDDVVGIYLARDRRHDWSGAGQRHRARAGDEQGPSARRSEGRCTARRSRRSRAPRSGCSTATWPRS